MTCRHQIYVGVALQLKDLQGTSSLKEILFESLFPPAARVNMIKILFSSYVVGAPSTILAQVQFVLNPDHHLSTTSLDVSTAGFRFAACPSRSGPVETCPDPMSFTRRAHVQALPDMSSSAPEAIADGLPANIGAEILASAPSRGRILHSMCTNNGRPMNLAAL